MPIPLRIALADDQELFIESLSALFANTNGEIEVVWNARSGEEAIEKVQAHKPDVLLLDYFFRGKNLDGGETCRLLRQEFPELGILMLSVSCEIAVIRESLSKGANGYASKEIGKNELLRGLRAVAEGEYFLDQSAMQEVIRAVIVPKFQDKPGTLTRREMEVALLYVKGKTIKEIASTLFISEDTVESHIKNIRSKTDCSSRFEVGEWLKKNGLWEE
ncbi:MAG TPA: response regulator transcription factor [Saprospiraceae bacterium]|nr:response regulator transcription factor [Saprospiraceae bacterium]